MDHWASLLHTYVRAPSRSHGTLFLNFLISHDTAHVFVSFVAMQIFPRLQLLAMCGFINEMLRVNHQCDHFQSGRFENDIKGALGVRLCDAFVLRVDFYMHMYGFYDFRSSIAVLSLSIVRTEPRNVQFFFLGHSEADVLSRELQCIDSRERLDAVLGHLARTCDFTVYSR